MTEEEKKLAIAFEEKLRKLIYLYNDQKELNKKLQSRLNEVEFENQKLQTEYTEMEQKYANIKLAKMMSLDDEDINPTKERLSKLVREIDQCIALLDKTA